MCYNEVGDLTGLQTIYTYLGENTIVLVTTANNSCGDG